MQKKIRINKNIKKALLVLYITIIPDIAWSESMLVPKVTRVVWDETVFALRGNQVEFDKDVRLSGIEYSYIFDNNLAIGAESLYGRWEVSSDSGAPGGWSWGSDGYANVYQTNIIAKYFIIGGNNFQSYIGAGYGNTKINLHSDTDVRMFGKTKQLSAGMEYKITNSFGMSIEYKRVSISVDDNNSNSIDTRYNVYQLGFNIHI